MQRGDACGPLLPHACAAKRTIITLWHQRSVNLIEKKGSIRPWTGGAENLRYHQRRTNVSRILVGIATFAATIVLATGCSLRSLSVSAHHHDGYGYAHREVVHHDVYYEPAPPRVYARRGHVCGYGCNDHYWNGVELVVIGGGHHHGPHCGHHWNGSRWTLVASKAHGPHHYKGVKVKHYKDAKVRHHKGVRVKVKKARH